MSVKEDCRERGRRKEEEEGRRKDGN